MDDIYLWEDLVNTIRDKLIQAIAVMDEKGRANEEDNSYMLWKKDWYLVRELLLDALKETAINAIGEDY